MERDNNLQLELFNQDKAQSKTRQPNGSVLSFLRGYEKTVLIIIAVLVTGIISFCLGVERGKQIALARNNAPFDLAAQAAPKPQINSVKPMVVTVQSSQQTITSVKPDVFTSGSFTIQLATYKSRVNAEQEANALKKKGLSPLVKTQGNFVVLCVGNFNNRQAAVELLAQLKKKYAGCYIRRL